MGCACERVEDRTERHVRLPRARKRVQRVHAEGWGCMGVHVDHGRTKEDLVVPSRRIGDHTYGTEPGGLGKVEHAAPAGPFNIRAGTGC